MELYRRGVAIINFVYIAAAINSATRFSNFIRSDFASFLYFVGGSLIALVYFFFLVWSDAPILLSEMERCMLIGRTAEELCLLGSSGAFCFGAFSVSAPFTTDQFLSVVLPTSIHTVLFGYAATGFVTGLLLILVLIRQIRRLPLPVVAAFYVHAGLIGIGVFNILFFTSILILNEEPKV